MQLTPQEIKKLREGIHEIVNRDIAGEVWYEDRGCELSLVRGMTEAEKNLLEFFLSRINTLLEERETKLKKSFIKHFHQSGELWFPYNFDDEEEEIDALITLEQHWDDIIKNN